MDIRRGSIRGLAYHSRFDLLTTFKIGNHTTIINKASVNASIFMNIGGILLVLWVQVKDAVVFLKEFLNIGVKRQVKVIS